MASENLKPKARELLALIEARMKESGIPYSQALAQIGREKRELYEDYREEVTGRKFRFETIGEPERRYDIAVIDCQQRLTELVQGRVKDKGISYRAALNEIAREDPALADAARRQVLRSPFR